MEIQYVTRKSGADSVGRFLHPVLCMIKRVQLDRGVLFHNQKGYNVEELN